MFIVKRRMISTGMDVVQRLLITVMILTKRELDITLVMFHVGSCISHCLRGALFASRFFSSFFLQKITLNGYSRITY